MQANSNCQLHNDPILIYKRNANNQAERGMCRFCIQQEDKNFVSIEEKQQEIQSIIDQVINQNQQSLGILEQVLQQIYDQQKIIKTSFDKIASIVIDNIEKIQDKINQLKQQKQNQIYSVQAIQNEHNALLRSNYDLSTILNQQVTHLYSNKPIQLYQSIEQLTKIVPQTQRTQIQNQFQNPQQQYQQNYSLRNSLPSNLQQNPNQIPNPYNYQNNNQQKVQQQPRQNKQEYQLMKQNYKKQIDYCYAITYNEDASIIFAGCGKLITVTSFENGHLQNQFQTLAGHTNNVTCICYQKRVANLVSGSSDKNIIVWGYDYRGQMILLQKLEGHLSTVTTILSNTEDNLIISGSQDKTIRFWHVVDRSWVCQQQLDVQFQVYGLSLNESNVQLISCGGAKEIVVMDKLQNKTWSITQQIGVNNNGLGICFISQSSFVFQQKDSCYLEIYEKDQLQQFFKPKAVLINSSNGNYNFYPIQFIKQKEILVIKNDENILILNRKQNQEFQVEQTIQFQTQNIFGKMSEDSKYLVTWDSDSQTFQVRTKI